MEEYSSVRNPASPENVELSRVMRRAAVWATLAMSPLLFLFLLSACGIDIPGYVGFLLETIQVFGCFAWGASLGRAIRYFYGLRVAWAIKLMRPFIFICGSSQIIAGCVFLGLDSCRQDSTDFAGVVIVFVNTLIVMAVGSSVLMKVLKGFLLALIGYGISFVITVMVIAMPLTTSPLAVVTMMLATGLCVAGWWAAVPQTLDLNLQTNGQSHGVTGCGAQPVTDGFAPLDFRAKQELMSYSDEQLLEIVNSDSPYISKAHVAAAGEIYRKRRIWELIKDYTDGQLMEIVADDSRADYNERDAASMELYRRQSQLLIIAIANGGESLVDSILADPDNYFDGYVLMAQQLKANKNQ